MDKKGNLLLFGMVQCLIALLYFTIPHFTPFTATAMPLTMIDVHTAFYPFFSWVYVSFFVLTFAGVMIMPYQKAVYCSFALAANVLLAAIVFYFFPSKIPNEAFYTITNPDFVLRIVRNADGNFNCFPSIHIANSMVVTYYVFNKTKKTRSIFFIVWLILIILSVISTKQHCVLDVLGASVLVSISIIATNKVFQKLNNLSKSVLISQLISIKKA